MRASLSLLHALLAASSLALSAPPPATAAIRELMSKYDPILLFASKLLKPQLSSDAGALYAWCRRLDQIVDDSSADAPTRRSRLGEWEDRFVRLCEGKPEDQLDEALLATLKRYPSLEMKPFRDMIQGMKSDAVESRRVASNEELEEYAYQVAGTVGLMLLPLLGMDKEEDIAKAKGPAIALGKAIQLTNILRDARPDSALGRIYLPQDEMEALGIAEEDVLAAKSTPAYRSLVKQKVARANDLLRQAMEGARQLPGAGPLFVSIIVELYRDYLRELGRRGYDNLSTGGERVKISRVRKLLSSLRAIVKVVPLPFKR